jgi:predicted phosphodiesterase
MPRLAHISDIHFGKSFNVPLWNNVKARISGFQPTIIVASGDFTDSPDPLFLLAAKAELQDLCDSFDPKAEFFVVPGNHDVLDFGNIWHPGAGSWFERVMFSDTTRVRAALEKSLGSKLGLNPESLGWDGLSRIKRLHPRNWIWKGLEKKCDGRVQSCDFWRNGKQWPSKSIHDRTLITCFNSNSSAVREFVFATGHVEADQITRISAPLPGCACPSCSAAAVSNTEGAILLRVAVLHHHPLPIAIDQGLQGGAAQARLEPFLILKNGADLMHELQRQRYDLVLHGHKHRPQFARVELRADDLEGYPLLVLAGGSTASTDEESRHNTLRNISTAPNGQLTVSTFEQGGAPARRTFREPLAVLKRRAFVATIERAKISTQEVLSENAIDSIGHLRSIDRTSGLRVTKEGHMQDGMVINVTLPLHGKRLPLDLEDSCRGKVTLRWEDSSGKTYNLDAAALPADAYCWLGIVQPLNSDSDPLTFGIHEAATNSISMSRWEMDERSRHRDGTVSASHHEELGFNVTYPVERLLLHLQFPPELDGITPEVVCQRHPHSPNFPLRFRREERPSPSDPLLDYVPEEDLTREEAKRLRYEAKERRWILDIDRPIPGNRYTLRWSVPDLIAGPKALSDTQDYQDQLLGLAGGPPGIQKQCEDIFANLAAQLIQRFRSKNPQERQIAFLMVYDRKNLSLRPVLTYVSSGSLPSGSYDLPLGEGLAGAAFLGRRILTWVDDPTSGSLIKPQPDHLNSKRVLALPIFYQEEERVEGGGTEVRMETRPGAVIGVVTFGSNNIASRILECHGEDKVATKNGRIAQQLAQSSVFEILNVLFRKPASPGRIGSGALPDGPAGSMNR